MQHRKFRPVFFQLFDGQALEQVFPSLEIILQGTGQQGFAE